MHAAAVHSVLCRPPPALTLRVSSRLNPELDAQGFTSAARPQVLSYHADRPPGSRRAPSAPLLFLTQRCQPVHLMQTRHGPASGSFLFGVMECRSIRRVRTSSTKCRHDARRRSPQACCAQKNGRIPTVQRGPALARSGEGGSRGRWKVPSTSTLKQVLARVPGNSRLIFAELAPQNNSRARCPFARLCVVRSPCRPDPPVRRQLVN